MRFLLIAIVLPNFLACAGVIAATDSTVLTHDYSVFDIAISPDGRFITTGGIMAGGRKTVWDVEKRQLIATLRAESGGGNAESLAFSPDGTLLAVGISTSRDYVGVELWDVKTWKRLPPLKNPFELLPERNTGTAESVAFSPDSKYVAASNKSQNSGGIDIWDVKMGALIRTMVPEGQRSTAMHSIAMSPDGGRIAGDMVLGEVRIWSTATGEVVTTLAPRAGGSIGAMAFSPDGRQLSVIYNINPGYGHLKTWNLESGILLHDINITPDHQAAVEALAYSPDGREIAVGGGGGVVHLFDSTSGAETGRLEKHPGRVGSIHGLVYSPDGGYLATCGDLYVKVWKLKK